MMSILTQIFVRRYAHRHALLIVFLSSAIWGVFWVPMRDAESFGISGLMGNGFVLYGLGLVVASVTKTTVLFYLTPVWATLFAYVALSE